MAAIDFTAIKVWTKGGLVTYYLLFVMELRSRRVQFSGCTTNPDEAWVKQNARNLTDTEDGFLNAKRYLIMDRDTKFCEAFREILENEGVSALRLPPRSPNLNANLEWYFRSLKLVLNSYKKVLVVSRWLPMREPGEVSVSWCHNSNLVFTICKWEDYFHGG